MSSFQNSSGIIRSAIKEIISFLAGLHQRSAGFFSSALHHVRHSVFLRHRAVRQLHGLLDRVRDPADTFLRLLLDDAGISVLPSRPRSQKRGDHVPGEATKQIRSSRPERGRRDTGEPRDHLRRSLSYPENLLETVLKRFSEILEIPSIHGF